MKVPVQIECPFCGGKTVLHIPIMEYLSYQKGKLSQHALKSLTEGERETFISGLCERCQKEIF